MAARAAFEGRLGGETAVAFWVGLQLRLEYPDSLTDFGCHIHCVN